VRQASREQDRLASDHADASAIARLAELLALPGGAAIALAEPSLPSRVVPEEPLLIEAALSGRPDLIAARAHASQADALVRSSRYAAAPSLSANGGYHVTSDSYVLNRQWFSASLDLEVPIIDGGLAAAKTDEALAHAAELHEAAEELAGSIRMQIHTTLLSLGEALSALPVAQQAAELASRRMTMVQDQYHGGLADMTTVLDAEDAHVRAQIDATSARYAVLRGWASLRYVAAQPQLGP
jgi:outer membrane protein TolC